MTQNTPAMILKDALSTLDVKHDDRQGTPMRNAIKLALLLAVCLVVPYVGWFLLIKPDPIPSAELLTTRASLMAQLESAWVKNKMRRQDGFIYAVDVGHLLIHAAHVRDKSLYTSLSETIVPMLVSDTRDDPYTRGFVGWRVRPGQAPDASGTTEALRIAKGLWLGGVGFNRVEDLELARMIVDGYGRHAYIDQGVWLIRNYFNFGTRSFANDSFLVDYDPDFVKEVAERYPTEERTKLARLSQEAVKSSQSPAGLIHTLIQPDIKTIMPDAPVTVFSPNDVIQVNNACTVAETVAKGLPHVAAGVLDFALSKGKGLKRSYYGRTGDVADETDADSTTWSCLVRLAARLNRLDDMEWLINRANYGWVWLVDKKPDRPYSLSEAVLAIDWVLMTRGVEP